MDFIIYLTFVHLLFWSLSGHNYAKSNNKYNSIVNKMDTRELSVNGGGSSGKYDARQVIVVAGNFSLDGEIVNIAQYEISSGIWTHKYRAELFVYGEANGVIWDIAVNESLPFNKLFLVGLFDSVTKLSQVQFCSVGEFDGEHFDKVGEGLCPRGVDSGASMRIYSTVIGNNGDIFVGGSFETRVWNGQKFVAISDIAMFDGATSSWVTLFDGTLVCSNTDDSVIVKTMAWDSEGGTLYFGGVFHGMNPTTPYGSKETPVTVPITTGLAMWTKADGLMSFPGGGLSNRDNEAASCFVQCIAFEPSSQSLFVAGTFHRVNGEPCDGIAVWHRISNTWRCLFQSSYYISTVTAMLLSGDQLYLSGWAAASSSWRGNIVQLPYAVARLNIAGYIDEHNYYFGTNSGKHKSYGGNGSSNSSNNSSSSNGTNHNAIGRASQSNNGRLAKRLLYQKYSYNRRLNKGLQHQHQHHHQPQSQQRIKKMSYHNNRWQKESDRYSLHTKSKITAESSKDCGRFTSVFASVECLLRFVSLYFTRSPSQQSVKHLSEENLVSESKKKIGRVRRKRQGMAAWSNFTVPPTQSPTPGPWMVHWEWLPNFSGCNGPIMKLYAGKHDFEGAIFIAGAFNNYPAIIAWRQTKGIANITGIGGGISDVRSISGLITSVCQVYFRYESSPLLSPTQFRPPDDYKSDYTFVILLACVLVGIMLGLGVAIGCVSKMFNSNQTVGFDPDLESGPDVIMMMGIPLKTLMDGQNSGSSSVDFKACFEKAMKARHLPTHESLLIINPKEIVLSRIIGEGSFGRVWSGQWRNNSVAVKEFVFAQTAIVGGSLQRNSIIEEIVGEAGVMACLRHPKILQLYGCSLTMQAIWIVSELCIHGSLRMVLNDKSIDLPLIVKLSICMDVADGMLYLHTRSPPIIHRDLKSHNIFITEPTPGHLVAKIGDWGSARAIALTGAKSMTHGVGTACWLSPEVINNAHFSKHSDVYAFGIVLWEVFTRQEIYEGLSAAQIIAKVAHEGLRPHVPRDCPWDSIMTSCWKQQAADRPEFQSILISLSKIYLKYRPSATAPAVIVRHVSRTDMTGLSESLNRKGVGNKHDLQIPETIAVVHHLDTEDFKSEKSKKSSGMNTSTAVVKESAFMGGLLSFRNRRKVASPDKGINDEDDEDSTEITRLLKKTVQPTYQSDTAAKPFSKTEHTDLLIKNFHQSAAIKKLDIGPDGGTPSINVTPIRHAIGSNSLKCWSMPITSHTSPIEKDNSNSKVGTTRLLVSDDSGSPTFEKSSAFVEKKRPKSTEARLARAKITNNSRKIPDRDAYFDVRATSRSVISFPTIPGIPSTPQLPASLSSEIENASSKSLLAESTLVQFERSDRNSSSLPNLKVVDTFERGKSYADKINVAPSPGNGPGNAVEMKLSQYPAYYIAENDDSVSERSNVYLFADHSPSLQPKANPSKP